MTVATMMNNVKRKVVMISATTGKRTEFSSIRDASHKTGLHEPCICRCCNGRQGTTGGFRFSYDYVPVADPYAGLLNSKEAARKCGIDIKIFKYKAEELGIGRVSKGKKRLYYNETDIAVAISKDLFRDRRLRRKSILLDE